MTKNSWSVLPQKSNKSSKQINAFVSWLTMGERGWCPVFLGGWVEGMAEAPLRASNGEHTWIKSSEHPPHPREACPSALLCFSWDGSWSISEPPLLTAFRGPTATLLVLSLGTSWHFDSDGVFSSKIMTWCWPTPAPSSYLFVSFRWRQPFFWLDSFLDISS